MHWDVLLHVEGESGTPPRIWEGGEKTFTRDTVTYLQRPLAKVIPDELVDDSAIVGDLDYVQEQIKAWEAAGVTMMVVGARSPEQIRDLAGLVQKA